MNKTISVFNNPKAWQAALLILVVVRIGMWWLFQHDMPQMIDHYQWQFYYGGDETLFFNRAKELITSSFATLPNGELRAATTGVGLPVIMAGLMLFTGQMTYEAILPFLVIGNGLLFAAVSVPVMSSWAKLLTGSRMLGLIVGALWTFLPYLLWLGFAIHPEAEVLRNAYVSRQMWVSGVTDSPSMFFVMLGMVLMLHGSRAYPQQTLTINKVVELAVGGLCIGFAAAIRIHILPVAFILVVAMLFARHWREVGIAIGGMLIGFIPQFWHNQLINGCFLDQPYINGWLHFRRDCSPWIDLTAMPFSPGFLIENVFTLVTRLPVLTFVGAVAGVVAVIAFVRCWQLLGGESAIIMFGGPAASLTLHIVTFVYKTDPVRFTLPAVSFGLTVLVWAVFWIIADIRRLRATYARKAS